MPKTFQKPVSKTASSEGQPSFDTAWSQAASDDPRLVELQDEHGSGLGLKLNDIYDEAKKDRQDIEQRWLRDLRQYKGKYDPEVERKIHPLRSKAFMRLTRSKVKTVTARLMDLLFPTTGEQNWGISPTPIPEMGSQVIQAVQMQLAQNNVSATSDQISHALQEDAEKRSEAMGKEIADQLVETKYQPIMREVVQSGNLFGTGILKGPLVGSTTAKRWVKQDGLRHLVTLEKMTPYIESVKIWDIYPDMAAEKLEDCEYVFQRHIYTKAALRKLAKRSDFDGKAIRAYIAAHRDGDTEYQDYETQLQTMALHSQGTVPDLTRNRFELKEFWGWIDMADLRAYDPTRFEDGGDLEGRDEHEIFINAWMVGSTIIKLAEEPLEGVEFPYYFYYYDKDETSLFGEGIASIMRDTQQLFNSSVRQMLDNAAVCAGPIFEVNLDLLADDEDPTDIHAFRTILRHGEGVDATAPAVRSFTVQSHTSEYMQMAELFSRYADETTAIPKYLAGQAQGSTAGAGRTASGLSMMFGSANILLKDQVKHFDDGITKPFIGAMYHWNMSFSTKDEIKGDMSVEAKGSASLVAKEVMTERLVGLMQATGNELDAPLFDRAAMWRDALRYYDMEGKYIKEPEQIEKETAERNAQAEQARVQAVIQDAIQRGVPIDKLYLQLLQGADPGAVAQETERQIAEAA